MAKFPYGIFGGEEFDAYPPWAKLNTFAEYVEDGDAPPPQLASWLARAIRESEGDAQQLLVKLGLTKPKGTPAAWNDPDAPKALGMLWGLITSGNAESDEDAISKTLEAFYTPDGEERFSHPVLQRWLAEVRQAEAEARNET